MRKGWKETTLGEVAGLSIGRTPTRATAKYWTGDLRFPFCTIADMDGKRISPSREGVTQAAIDDGKARLVGAGSLLMSFKLTIGRVGFAEVDLFPNEAIVAITPEASHSTREFLYLWLGSHDLTEGSGRAVKGATLNSVSLAAIPILLPPLAEQKRIVDVIESVDAYVAGLESYATAARTSRAALLHELLTTNTKGWKQTTLGEVAEVVGGGTPSTSRADFWDGEIVWLTPTEVVALDGRRVSDSARKITKQGLANSGARLLPEGTVILTSRASVGFVAISDCELCTNQGFQSLVPRPQIIAEFLLPWVQTNRSEFMARSAGSTFKEISKKNVGTIPILLPPLAEQRRIVDVIESVDSAITAADVAVADARNLRAGLLSDLLSGDHEIPQSYDRIMESA